MHVKRAICLAIWVQVALFSIPAMAADEPTCGITRPDICFQDVYNYLTGTLWNKVKSTYDKADDIWNELQLPGGKTLADLWNNVTNIKNNVTDITQFADGVKDFAFDVKDVAEGVDFKRLKNAVSKMKDRSDDALDLLEYMNQQFQSQNRVVAAYSVQDSPCDDPDLPNNLRKQIACTTDTLQETLNSTLDLHAQVMEQGPLAGAVPELQIDLQFLKERVMDPNLPDVLFQQVDQLFGDQLVYLLDELRKALLQMEQAQTQLAGQLGLTLMPTSHLQSGRGVKDKAEAITYYAVGCEKLLDAEDGIGIAVTVMDAVVVVADLIAGILDTIEAAVSCCDVSVAISVGGEVGVGLGVHPVAYLASLISGASEIVSAVSGDISSSVDQCGSEFQVSTTTCYQYITMCMLEPGMQSSAKNRDLREYCWEQVHSDFDYCPQPF